MAAGLVGVLVGGAAFVWMLGPVQSFSGSEVSPARMARLLDRCSLPTVPEPSGAVELPDRDPPVVTFAYDATDRDDAARIAFTLTVEGSWAPAGRVDPGADPIAVTADQVDWLVPGERIGAFSWQADSRELRVRCTG